MLAPNTLPLPRFYFSVAPLPRIFLAPYPAVAKRTKLAKSIDPIHLVIAGTLFVSGLHSVPVSGFLTIFHSYRHFLSLAIKKCTSLLSWLVITAHDELIFERRLGLKRASE